MEFRHKPNPTHIQILVRVWVLPVGTRILGTSQAILPSYFCDCMKRLHTVIKRTSEGKITEEYIPRIQFLNYVLRKKEDHRCKKICKNSDLKNK